MKKSTLKLSILVLMVYCLGVKAQEIDFTEFKELTTYVEMDSKLRTHINLNGIWQFQIDPNNAGYNEKWHAPAKVFSDEIKIPCAWQSQSQHPKFNKLKSYFGSAWFKQTFKLDQAFPNKIVWLRLGSIYPCADIWVNGKYVATCNQPGLPVKFDITDFIQSKNNSVCIRIREDYRGLGNWYSLNASWSGIWRDVSLEVTESTWIDDIFIIPDIDNKSVKVRTTIKTKSSSIQPKTLKAFITTENKNINVGNLEQNFSDLKSLEEFTIPLNSIQLWSPDNPFLYHIRLELYSLKGDLIDSVSDRFGMRKIENRGRNLYLNNQQIFLRGCGDDGMYPITLHPETDTDIIKKHMKQIKEFGFNYIYPCLIMQPEEYLDAADEVGLLVQYDAAAPLAFQRGWPPQLPKVDLKQRDHIIKQQWEGLLHWTQNHPSIIIYSTGSELIPESVLDEMYEIAKTKDSTRLVESWSVRQGSNDIMDVGNLMDTLDASEELHQIMKTWAWPYDEIPGLIHEYIGAESLHDPELIDKFTSGMTPSHAIQIKQACENLGISHLQKEFVKNSKKLSNICRKFEIEEAQKVDVLAGYNMWLIQDIPICPQGIFDPFWNVKDISPEEFAKSNGPTVLTMTESTRTTKRSFWACQKATFEIQLSNRTNQSINDATLCWSLRKGKNKILSSGEIKDVNTGEFQISSAYPISISMPQLKKPEKATLDVRLKTKTKEIIQNSWDIWIFSKVQKIDENINADFYDLRSPVDTILCDALKRKPDFIKKDIDILVTNGFDDFVGEFLLQGGNVLFILKDLECLVKTQFMPRWPLSDIVNISATIINEHPSIKDFPHDGFCEYQFYHMLSRVIPNTNPVFLGYEKGRAEAINLNLFESKVEPVIGVFHTQSRCAYLMEAKTNNGKMMITTFDIAANLKKDVASDYLFMSLIKYMASEDFVPQNHVKIEELKKFAIK